MLYSVSGTVSLKEDHMVVIETGGFGVKLYASAGTMKALPPAGSSAKMYTHLYVREDALDLYGFGTAEELRFFEMLISVSGVGPKSALSILDVAPLDQLSAAIKEGRPDLLTRASGVGRKTAERVIVELRTKVQSATSGLVVGKMEADADVVEALVTLGYRRDEAKNAVAKVGKDVEGTEDRLRAALRNIGRA